MASSETKDQAFKDIAAHLAEFGPQDWDKVRGKYRDVPDPTWWRWVKRVRDGIATGESLATARRKLSKREKSSAPDELAAKVASNLPVAPSPDYIARNGEKGLQNIDYLEAINGLFQDSLKLREYSLNKDGGIRIPAFFEKSIRSRLDVLNTGASLLQQVYDLRRMEAFYQAILEEIGKESTELQHRVIARLARLNEATGFSYHPAG